jgi:hypothetical protein
VHCVGCGSIVQRRYGDRDCRPDELLRCSRCGWELTWGEYHRTFQKKHFQCTGLREFFEEYCREYPRAGSYQQKIILIDRLLHRFHRELEEDRGGTGAANLIGGTRREVVAFLNELTYGEHTTASLRERLTEWRKLAGFG